MARLHATTWTNIYPPEFHEIIQGFVFVSLDALHDFEAVDHGVEPLAETLEVGRVEEDEWEKF